MNYIKFKLVHLTKVVNLLNLCFPKNNITKDSFLWKHFDDFFDNKSLGMIAIDKKTKNICSFACFTPIFITNNKNIFKNFYLCAVQCTHPNHRKRRIISKLTKDIENKLGDKINYIGFSNISGLKIDKFSKKINYKILGQFKKKFVLSFPYRNNIQIKKIIKLREKIDYDSIYFSIFKNSSYLKWRYKNNPKNKYEYFEIKNKNEIIGCFICKRNKFSYEVFDLILNDYNASLCKLVIKSFSKFAFFQGKLVTSYSFLENNFWKESFYLIFSFSKNIPIFFTLKTKVSDFKNIENWILQRGDIL